MAGKIRTRETKCPHCGVRLVIKEEVSISCPQCPYTPKTYYIYLYWHGRHIIARDPDGHILDTYQRAHRLLTKIRAEIDLNVFEVNNYLIKEIEQFRGRVLFPKWFDYLSAKGNAKSYLVKIRQYMDTHFTQFDNLNMRDIKTHHIEDFRQYLSTVYINQRTGGRLSPSSVKHVMDALKAFCHWLYRREIIARVPHFDTVVVPKPLINIMPLQDRNKVFSVITSPNLYVILNFLSLHPVRPSEACALDVRHFDLQSRTVDIEQALDVDRSIKPRKSKQAYALPLSPHFDTSYIKDRFGKEIAFPNKDGNRYTAHTLNKAWRLACERAGVPYLNLYNTMKHTTLTNFALNGASESELEALAGHSTRGMAKRYIQKSVEMLRHLMDGSQVVQIDEKRERK